MLIYQERVPPSLSPIKAPIEKKMGGVIPRHTDIARQPHGLSVY